jgi:hypothetical protein
VDGLEVNTQKLSIWVCIASKMQGKIMIFFILNKAFENEAEFKHSGTGITN